MSQNKFAKVIFPELDKNSIVYMHFFCFISSLRLPFYNYPLVKRYILIPSVPFVLLGPM